jgi:hypothetical protein
VAGRIRLREETAIPTDDDDISTSEGRFGRPGINKSGGWTSAVATAVTIIIVRLVFYFRAKLTGL